MRPSQADDLVDEQPSKPDAVATSIALRVFAAAQPADADQEWNGPDEPFGKEWPASRQSTGCSGALSQRKNVWLSDSMKSPGRIASMGDPAILAGGQSCLSWSSS
jgi:hypothetical protein